MQRDRVLVRRASLVVELEVLTRDAHEELEVLVDDAIRVLDGKREVGPFAFIASIEIETP